MNLAISAVKFLYKVVIKDKTIFEQHRPRHDKRLPVVLSKEEIFTVLKSLTDLKHKLLLMIAYSSGLRVSEIVQLKLQNIDINSKTITIISGKAFVYTYRTTYFRTSP